MRIEQKTTAWNNNFKKYINKHSKYDEGKIVDREG